MGCKLTSYLAHLGRSYQILSDLVFLALTYAVPSVTIQKLQRTKATIRKAGMRVCVCTVGYEENRALSA